MAHADDYEASLDPRVISQVTAAIYSAAQQIYTEASPPPNHAGRATFANKIMSNQVNLQALIASACCFASLNASSTDTAVNNAVFSLWNTWANA